VVIRLRTIVIIVLFIFLGGVVFYLSRERKPSKIKTSSLKQERLKRSLPGIQFTKTSLTEVDKQGNLIWEVKAKRFIIDKEKGKIRGQEVKGVFYQKKKEAFSFRCGEIVLDEKSRDLILSKGVEGVSSSNGIKMRGEKIRWEAKNRRLLGSGKTLFKKGRFKISADYLEADIAFKKVRVKGRTRTEID